MNLVLMLVLMLNKTFSSTLLTSSVGLITVEVFVVGLGDLQFDVHAYTIGTFSVFAQVMFSARD